MEGITPTLAFAALFFGLSGHPQDRGESALNILPAEQVHAADYQVWSKVPCADLAGVADGTDPWSTVFEHESALASTSLGEPGEAPAADEQLEAGSYMSFEGPLLAYEDVAGPDGCGTSAPRP